MRMIEDRATCFPDDTRIPNYPWQIAVCRQQRIQLTQSSEIQSYLLLLGLVRVPFRERRDGLTLS